MYEANEIGALGAKGAASKPSPTASLFESSSSCSGDDGTATTPAFTALGVVLTDAYVPLFAALFVTMVGVVEVAAAALDTIFVVVVTFVADGTIVDVVIVVVVEVVDAADADCNDDELAMKAAA